MSYQIALKCDSCGEFMGFRINMWDFDYSSIGNKYIHKCDECKEKELPIPNEGEQKKDK